MLKSSHYYTYTKNFKWKVFNNCNKYRYYKKLFYARLKKVKKMSKVLKKLFKCNKTLPKLPGKKGFTTYTADKIPY